MGRFLSLSLRPGMWSVEKEKGPRLYCLGPFVCNDLAVVKQNVHNDNSVVCLRFAFVSARHNHILRLTKSI